MGVVCRLPSALANQIAAGEVVERPASAVKELIENAIDAGASRIEVAIDHGGLGAIVVLDDGVGMSEEDAVLSLERHATSKIREFDDLTKIGTFGFRGEALPSIASVSRFRLTTRRAGDKTGVAITVDETGALSAAPAGSAEGTRVEATDLFFNVPARRKFLKSVATETAHVNDVVRSAALSRHDITFVLRRDGKISREYLRAASRHERAIALAQGEPLLPVRFARGPLTVEAYLAPPERARAGANHLDILVNGRPVRDLKLARAVAHSFGGLLDGGRYPFGVLYLDLPSHEVDVNVHPQKSEVRFADSRAVYEALRFALERELAPSLGGHRSRPAIGSFVVGARSPGGRISDSAAPVAQPPAPTRVAPAPIAPAVPDAADEPSLFKSVRFYASLRYVGQSRAAYLLCEGADGLYVLDQHASSERLLLHRLRSRHRAGTLAAAALSAAETVQLGAEPIAALEAAESQLTELGIELHRVSENAVSVSALPEILLRRDAKAIVTDLAGALAQGARLDSLFAKIACHGALRAGDPIAPAEAERFLTELDDVDFSLPCPHGRPVLYRLAWNDVERKLEPRRAEPVT